MPIVPTELIDKITKNRYEAVIIAAQHARHLNSRRLEKVAMLEENAGVEIDGRKITGIALQDLVDGKVKYHRRGSTK
ncbi:MAG: DNA-directed RNA polymerase subunit omega [candidate division Zixibacteria bacterium]|jgi:DNA-directed RNA polymerase omega subunit|nr:DNA-directed RNA polymerase subunit omega [candidate division Zixibacteria bacterium]